MEDGMYDELADERYGEWDDDPPRGTYEELAAWFGLVRGIEEPPPALVQTK